MAKPIQYCKVKKKIKKKEQKKKTMTFKGHFEKNSACFFHSNEIIVLF